jgi:hypothetical protein
MNGLLCYSVYAFILQEQCYHAVSRSISIIEFGKLLEDTNYNICGALLIGGCRDQDARYYSVPSSVLPGYTSVFKINV